MIEEEIPSYLRETEEARVSLMPKAYKYLQAQPVTHVFDHAMQLGQQKTNDPVVHVGDDLSKDTDFILEGIHWSDDIFMSTFHMKVVTAEPHILPIKSD